MKYLNQLVALIVTAISLLVPNAAIASMSTIRTAAASTATYTSSDITKTSEQQTHVIMVVSAVPGVVTLTMKIQGKDAAGNYYDIIAGTASAATGTVVLKVGPGIATVANVAIGDMLPDVYRVVVTHSGAGSFTYGIYQNTSQ